MNDNEMTWPEAVRIVRSFTIAALILNIVETGLHLAGGQPVPAAIFFGVALAIVAALRWQTCYLRRKRAAVTPRADYAAIARMEREVWGRAFEHDGAPDMTVAELKATMDDLAERGTARLRPCIGCGYSEARVGGKCPDCYQRAKRGRDDRRPDTTAPATIDQYAAWLRGYVKQGGKPTHYYDYPFSNARFRYASTRLTIDSGYEFGARSRMIVVASGVSTQRTNPAGPFGGWAHTKVFFMHGHRANDIVPVYSDPEFDFTR